MQASCVQPSLRQLAAGSPVRPSHFTTQHVAPRPGSLQIAMGIRHVVLLKLIPEVTPAQLSALKESLGKLPAIIPQIKAYTFGPDARISEGNADFAIVADFDNEVDFKSYATHPEHVSAISNHIKPIVAQRTAVQMQT